MLLKLEKECQKDRNSREGGLPDNILGLTRRKFPAFHMYTPLLRYCLSQVCAHIALLSGSRTIHRSKRDAREKGRSLHALNVHTPIHLQSRRGTFLKGGWLSAIRVHIPIYLLLNTKKFKCCSLYKADAYLHYMCMPLSQCCPKVS